MSCRASGAEAHANSSVLAPTSHDRLDNIELLDERAAGEVGVEGRGRAQEGDVAQEDVDDDDHIHRGVVRSASPAASGACATAARGTRPPELVHGAAPAASFPPADDQTAKDPICSDPRRPDG